MAAIGAVSWEKMMSESPVATGLEERLQSVRESAEPPAMPTEVSERIFRL